LPSSNFRDARQALRRGLRREQPPLKLTRYLSFGQLAQDGDRVRAMAESLFALGMSRRKESE
jgi:hypothetical protein